MLLHAANTSGVIDEVVKPVRNVQGMLQCRMSDTGYLPLHITAKLRRSVRIICQLLKLGTNPLAKDNNELTPAYLARASEQTLIAQLLDRAAQDTQQQQQNP